jgi:REP element-mobilizing transposase RayT
MHRVFATRERRPVIKPKLQQRLWPYLGGIARENKMRALIVGGVEDHVHVLLSIMTWSAPNLKSLPPLAGLKQACYGRRSQR